jgi:hypothetical protein
MTPTRLWLLFVDPARKAPATPTLTDAEAVAVMKSHVGWTGKYTHAAGQCALAIESCGRLFHTRDDR